MEEIVNHDEAPVLDALADYHRREHTPFTPPGHKHGRGADPRVRAALGEDVFRNDLLATSGLDDRSVRIRPGDPARRAADGRRRRRRTGLLLHLRQLAVGQERDARGHRSARTPAGRVPPPVARTAETPRALWSATSSAAGSSRG